MALTYPAPVGGHGGVDSRHALHTARGLTERHQSELREGKGVKELPLTPPAILPILTIIFWCSAHNYNSFLW
ncbi:hypothetical protein E2C01_012054 [Portunus trituberculatus]|uniref:Uncharacterized protein n=1 Tax=Portunus trituberculatus TaxID=210409 RepID=A0A5B7DDH5_PORTR|nr:hypothetical protein [Portunus trituberculatus]